MSLPNDERKTMKRDLRKYGKEPYRIAVIHGGPGLPGDAAQLARQLSSRLGVLEPLLTADSIEGQIEELRQVIENDGDDPIYLIGHSWGAWLTLLFSAEYPKIVEKTIIIGSGPLEDEYASEVTKNRRERLDTQELREFEGLMRELSRNDDSKGLDERFKELLTKTDYYDPIEHENDFIEFKPKVYKKVWTEAESLRREGKLMERIKGIKNRVVAIHGDHDPHPYEGVKEPLSRALDDSEFMLLERCGHYPWYEKHARGKFFEVIDGELEAEEALD